MKKVFASTFALVSAVAAVGTVSGATIVENATATQLGTYALGGHQQTGHTFGQSPNEVSIVGPGANYSNVTNFGGSGVTHGGATTANLNTFAIADDLTTNLPASGGTLTKYTFSVANFNSAARTVKPSVRFFDDDGVDGTPGTLLGGTNFNAVSVAAGSIGLLTYTIPAAGQFAIPEGKVWAMMFFGGGAGTTTATAAELNNIGQALFNPPDVGTSTADEWDSMSAATSAGSFATANPDGFIYGDGYGVTGATPANFGWELTATVPEPTTLAALAGLGVIGLRRRGR